MGTAALGWGLLTEPAFATFLTLVGTLIAVITVIASVVSARAARRGLYVSTVAVDRAWDSPASAGRRVQQPGPDPHRMVIRFTYRGSAAIEADHFDGEEDLVFDVGAGIIKVEECRTDPQDAPKPRFRFRGDSLLLSPAMINPGTSIYAPLLIENAPARPVTCTRAVLANVRVQSVEDADAKARAYLASAAGAAAIVVALLLARAVPALAYRIVATLACAIAFAAILAAKIRRPRSAVALSMAVLVGLVASIGWLDAGPARARYHPQAQPRPGLVIHRSRNCPSVGGGTWTALYHVPNVPNDNEIVGYSSKKQLFVNASFATENQAQRTQDTRVRIEEQQIYAGNAQADCDYKIDYAAGDVRPLVELVYFAGITEGADEDYDSGEAEELEGLLGYQQGQNRPSAQSNTPLLKIIIANGGSKMQDAMPVAQHLVALADRDPHVLGVVGMDRSIKHVQAAIRLFAHNHLTTVATTLSADHIGQGAGRYYYQLTPANSSEASQIRDYIEKVVPAYFKQSAQLYHSGGQATAHRIVIDEPDRSSDDFYTSTMVDDLKGQPWRSAGLPRPQVIYEPDSALCGDSTVDIYAGRHDQPVGRGTSYDNDFTSFLSHIAGCRGPQPFIIADDGVTRFVADPAQRKAYTNANGQPLQISYVTKGIAILRTEQTCLRQQTASRLRGPMGTFCQAYAGIAATLRAKLPGLKLLWTGERVGLAYDAAHLFLTAASRMGQQPDRAQIPEQFQKDREVVGVTGAVNFADSNIGADRSDGMPLAIVRLDLGNTDSTPTCEFPGQYGALYGPGPGNSSCPNSGTR